MHAVMAGIFGVVTGAGLLAGTVVMARGAAPATTRSWPRSTRSAQAAVKANDAATMDRILADDFVLVTGRGQSYTKADLLENARSKTTSYQHQEEEDNSQGGPRVGATPRS
jgi:hypothetical protein